MLRAPSLLVPAPLRVPGGGSPGVQPLRVGGLGIGPGLLHTDADARACVKPHTDAGHQQIKSGAAQAR